MPHKAKRKKNKDQPAAGLCGIDGIGSHAKSRPYGRSHCRLGRGSAHPSGREAFLRHAAFAYEKLWNFDLTQTA